MRVGRTKRLDSVTFFFGWGVGSFLERKNHEILSLTFRTIEVEEVEVQLFKFIDLHISYKLSYVN